MWGAILALVVFSGQAAAPDTMGRMQTWSRSLGVDCSHCHVPGAWSVADKPAFEFAGRMARMVEAINTRVLTGFDPITCWTCHRGQALPARLPREAWESIAKARAEVFQGPHEKRALAMAVYSASLGVECSHCHVEGAWADDSKPAKSTVRVMSEIFTEIPKHFEPSRVPVTQCFMCHQGAVRPER